MSTNPEDRLVTVLSQWLAGHVDDDELKREVEAADTSALDPKQVEAVNELREQLADADGSGDLEMVARETLQALALGD
jgi:ATPase subunit of ABC transporter with duplicated ATPase domains